MDSMVAVDPLGQVRQQMVQPVQLVALQAEMHFRMGVLPILKPAEAEVVQAQLELMQHLEMVVREVLVFPTHIAELLQLTVVVAVVERERRQVPQVPAVPVAVDLAASSVLVEMELQTPVEAAAARVATV